jgi:hypothetical protein
LIKEIFDSVVLVGMATIMVAVATEKDEEKKLKDEEI